jgi:hypothetical protein
MVKRVMECTLGASDNGRLYGGASEGNDRVPTSEACFNPAAACIRRTPAVV